MSTDAASAEPVDVTEDAVERALALMEEQELDPEAAGLRLFVQQGGCAGLSYGMRFEREPEDEDRVVEQDGLRVFVDQASLSYLEDSVLDFESGLQAEGFHVENPNVVSECGCGESFRT